MKQTFTWAEISAALERATRTFTITNTRPPFYEPVLDKGATKEARAAMRFLIKTVGNELKRSALKRSKKK